MRRTALKCIYEMAKSDSRIVYIGSDVTKGEIASYQKEFPHRFLMEGVYEGHLVGMAAGLALSGKIPYVNTIASFLTRRCYEQVLVDLCVHDLPVRLIGNGGGMVYAPLGSTHVANEDIAIFRVIPNMTIVVPCDADEMKRLMPKTLDWPHPIYIRLAKGGDPIISTDKCPFEIGKAIPLREGKDILFVSTGTMSHRAMQAADALALKGIGASVLHVHTVKPLDKEQILERASEVRVIVSVEEHRITGGLGSAVAELLSETMWGTAKRFRRLGFPDTFGEDLGSQDEILDKYGLSVETIVRQTEALMG